PRCDRTAQANGWLRRVEWLRRADPPDRGPAGPGGPDRRAVGGAGSAIRRPRIDLARVPHGAPGPVATPARGAAPARRPGLARERGGGPARALSAGRDQ